ncbi:MAG: MarR family transcriptional regulator [Streptomycetaceae bacterium]|nr:MarR family transcriptional regulator [Streptomycetaceae bacterium]
MTAATGLDLADALTHTAKRIRRAALRRLAPLGLTPAQGRALHVIAAADGTLRPGGLADRLHIAPRSATSVVDALESHGLVTRTPAPDDRRATVLHITAAGTAVLAASREAREAVATDYFAALTDTDRATLLALLAKAEAAHAPDSEFTRKPGDHPHGHKHGHKHGHGHHH